MIYCRRKPNITISKYAGNLKTVNGFRDCSLLQKQESIISDPLLYKNLQLNKAGK